MSLGYTDLVMLLHTVAFEIQIVLNEDNKMAIPMRLKEVIFTAAIVSPTYKHEVSVTEVIMENSQCVAELGQTASTIPTTQWKTM